MVSPSIPDGDVIAGLSMTAMEGCDPLPDLATSILANSAQQKFVWVRSNLRGSVLFPPIHPSKLESWLTVANTVEQDTATDEPCKMLDVELYYSRDSNSDTFTIIQIGHLFVRNNPAPQRLTTVLRHGNRSHET